MDLRTIRCEAREGVGTVTLARPDRRNAISVEMRREISACLARWRDDRDVGVVILTGEGSAFSAGFDLAEFDRPELHREVLESSSRYHRDVWAFPKPVIAAVNGPALGGGFDLACLCDVRLASANASFGHPEVKLGAPPLFTPLRWIVGDGVARELCLTGRRVSADEALRLRLASEVVEADALAERARALASTILEAPPRTLEFTKRYLVSSAGAGFEESFRVEHDRAFEEIILAGGLRRPPRPR